MATLPALLNEVTIKFQQLDRPGALLDPDFNEPIGGDIFVETIIETVGQVNLRGGPFRRRANTLTGDEEDVRGHVVLRLSELVDKGLATDDPEITFSLRKGDRVVQLASQIVNFEIVEIRPESPLDSLDEDALLVFIEFIEPAEERRGVRP